jgi:hypothetical protein
MTTIHNIQRILTTAISTVLVWSDSLCQDIIEFFHYNNEPKQGKSWSGYNMS